MVTAIQNWHTLRANAQTPSPVPLPAGLTYSQNPLQAVAGAPLTTDSPSLAQGTATLYTVSPALPAGLALNATTGVITGTPTAPSPSAAYVITATNSSGSTTANLTIQINDVAPANLTYSQIMIMGTIGVAIANNAPTSSGGLITNYTVSPALPAGLALNSLTGVISGTPSAAAVLATYTITASNSGGSATAIVSIQINATPPTNLTYAKNPLVATVKTPIAADTPTSNGGTPTSYSVSPALPTGLSLNTSTGVISGTPSAVLTTSTFTVVASNSGGSTSVPLNIQVNDTAPAGLSYAQNPLVATKGVTFPNDMISSSGGSITAYGVSPPLPLGFSLNVSTGAISGTPSALLASTPFVVTASGSGGSANVTLNVQVNDVPPTGLTYAQSSIVATQGVAITADSPSSSGGAVTSYTVSPALPAGIVLDSSSGVISGTPTATSALASYVVKASNSGGSAVFTLSLQVKAAVASSLTYSQNSIVASKGSAISSDLPTLSGGMIASSYSVSPSLPAGLSLSTTSGTISGTPTTISALAPYTITVTTTSGATATAVVNIQVNDIPPSSLLYSQTNLVATKGSSITNDVPTSGGGAVISYSVSPSLPSGLSLNSTTGVISGTPALISTSSTYTITGSNSGGSTSVAITIQVNDVAPSSLIYSQNPLVATKGVVIANDLPSASGGAVISYSVSPALPAGLSLNTSTGVISGIPTAMSSSTSYTVTATNSGGSATASLTLTVKDVAPATLTYWQNPLLATKGSAIANDTPSSSGGAIISYNVTPALPAGLSLNTSTGVISGTPSVISVLTPYTVTATNTGGSTSVVLNVQINDTAPKGLMYTSATATYLTGTAIANNTPSSTGGAVVSYSVAPALPAGLSLNTSTGVISGTPTAATAAASYTVTAMNSGGSATTVLNLTVLAPNSSDPNANWTYINKTILPNCTACHSPGSGQVGANDFTTYAGVMTTVTANQPLNSPFYTYIAPGATDPMPKSGPLTSVQISAVLDWIYVGAPGPVATPTPSPSPMASPTPTPTPSGSTSVLTTANTKLRVMPRNWVAKTLTNIFGSSATASVNSLVTNQISNFGGPCDPYNGALLPYSGGGVPTVIGDCDTLANTQASMIPAVTALREALMVRVCDLIVSNDTAVYNAAALAMGVASVTSLSAAPTSAQLSALYGLFYYGQSPPSAVSTAFAGIVTQAQTNGYPAIESWRFILQALCNAPDWQIP